MAIVYKAYAIEGLSGDTKPTLVPTGRKFYETDTDLWYDFNGSSWDKVSTESPFGDGSDGNVTISVNTDLGADNDKQYNNLTINSGVELTGNHPLIIRVKGTLTFGSGTSKIEGNGKGGAGGTAESASSPNGGAGGGGVYVYAGTISGTGIIEANGEAGDNAAATSGTGATGGDGGNGEDEGTTVTSSGGNGCNASINRGATGGASYGDGGDSGDGNEPFPSAFVPALPSIFLNRRKGAGGGAGGENNGYGIGGAGGGGGMVLVFSYNTVPAITVNAKGGDGGDNFTAGNGSGGGSGGYVVICTPSSSATISVTAGAGGSGAGGGADGFAGGAGQSYVRGL